MKSSVVVLGLCFSFSALAVQPETVRNNNKGVEAYKGEQYFEAYEKFAESLGNAPFNAMIQLNLALTFQSNEEEDKAMAAFEAAKKMADQFGSQQDVFFATFDLATATAMKGNIDRAIELFQECLEISPGNPMVRENIEKMWNSQGGQGGKGDDQDKNKDKDKDQQQDGEGEDPNNEKDPQQNQQPNGDQKKPPEQKKPKPFDSKELSKDDVRKILEELKNQEQKIRAEVYEGQGKDKPRDKDW